MNKSKTQAYDSTGVNVKVIHTPSERFSFKYADVCKIFLIPS